MSFFSLILGWFIFLIYNWGATPSSETIVIPIFPFPSVLLSFSRVFFWNNSVNTLAYSLFSCQMCGPGLSLALMVILCTVQNSLPYLHTFFCCVFLNTNSSAGQKPFFHAWTLLCGMPHLELTIACHYCECNGISGESQRGWIYCRGFGSR